MRLILVLLAVLLATTAPAGAQNTRDARRPFEILDNSFLVEEAFNQEAGVFQNILLVQRASADEWTFEFTQEWPMWSQRHQLSYTIPLTAVRPFPGSEHEFMRGPIAFNYRLQLQTEAAGRPAISPRLSLLLPAEDESGVDFQFNLPVSKQFADIYVHVNAGLLLDGLARDQEFEARPHFAGSLIHRTLPMVHLMVESVYRFEAFSGFTGTRNSWLLSPGLRAGWNLGTHQLVLGAAVPIGLLEHDDQSVLLLYVSYELPFRTQR